MHKKEDLKAAIKNFSGYPPKFCEVFNSLIDISTDYEVIVNAVFLCQNSNIKKSTFYFAIQRFREDGLISKELHKSSKIVFQKNKLDYYVKLLHNFNINIKNKKNTS
jgi:hypothetical protein